MRIEDFVLARIAEEEQLARAVVDSHEMWDWESYVAQAGMYDEPASEFATRHDPARVLAECAARREILRLCRECEREGYDNAAAYLEDAMRALASVYADHPDYEGWRP